MFQWHKHMSIYKHSVNMDASDSFWHMTTAFPCFFWTIPTAYLSMHTCYNSYIYTILNLMHMPAFCSVQPRITNPHNVADSRWQWRIWKTYTYAFEDLAALSKQRDATTVFIYSTTLTLSHLNFLPCWMHLIFHFLYRVMHATIGFKCWPIWRHSLCTKIDSFLPTCCMQRVIPDF